jgi:hypothetical protein
VAIDTKRSQVPEVIRAASRERHDVIHLEPNAAGAAGDAPIAVSAQDTPTRPLPGPAVPAAGGVVPPVAWASADRRALRTSGPGREGAAVEAASHSLSPPLTPLPERTDAPPDGCRVGRIAEEHVAEPVVRAAAEARPIGDRAVGFGEPPVMHAPAHGLTTVIVMAVCGVRPLAFRATSSTT